MLLGRPRETGAVFVDDLLHHLELRGPAGGLGGCIRQVPVDHGVVARGRRHTRMAGQVLRIRRRAQPSHVADIGGAGVVKAVGVSTPAATLEMRQLRRTLFKICRTDRPAASAIVS